MKNKLLLIIAFFTIQISVQAQGNVIVLPTNGTPTGYVSPQDTLKYQRQFYLIRQNEMQKAGFQSGMAINSIGFTNAFAPDSTTKGLFKVYLQNTNDALSRKDTTWTDISVPSGGLTNIDYELTNLIRGEYELQVISCGGLSVDTARTGFASNLLTGCGKPTGLNLTNISTNTATINWIAPISSGSTTYVLEIDSLTGNNPIVDTLSFTTAEISYGLSALLPNTYYRWAIKTKCGGDYSESVAGTFITEPNIGSGCGNIFSSTTSSITTIGATLSWGTAASAIRYTVQYRRSGTTAWTSNTAFTNGFNVTGLKPGTIYEWRVRAICNSGVGVWRNSANFTTSGTTACYSPEVINVNFLTDSSATISWKDDGVSTYLLRYRLKSFINWTSVVGTSPTDMTIVHDDSLTIPNTIGAFGTTFRGTGTSPFTYTGGAVYVAFEYKHIANRRASTLGTALATTGDSTLRSIYGYDSLSIPLSFGATHRSLMPMTLVPSNLRPETRFGSTAIADSVEVVAVYAQGNYALGYNDTASIRTLIRNHSSEKKFYSVTLQVKDAVTGLLKYTDLIQDSIVADSVLQFTFHSWVPTSIGKDSIVISVPKESTENYTLNNRNYIIQNVNSTIASHVDASPNIAPSGVDTTEGILLCKYFMSGCGKVNSVQVYLTNQSVNHSIYGVIMNEAGSIIDTSFHYTPDSTDINKYRSFYFPSLPYLRDTAYYVGLAQTDDVSNNYNPVGTQWEGTYARTESFYQSKLNGDSLVARTKPGRLMIRSEIISAIPSVSIAGSLALCDSAATTLTAVRSTVRFANQIINFSSARTGFKAAEALGTPNVYPLSTINNNTWISETADGSREYITLGFSNPSISNYIDIYETSGAGAVDTVYVKNPTTGLFEVKYSGPASTLGNASRINRIRFAQTSYNVSEVRIAINSQAVPGYYALDAVAIGYADSSANSSLDYLWSSGQTLNAISATEPTTYSVTVIEAGSCPSTGSVQTYVQRPVRPIITTFPSNATVCAGNSVTLTSSITSNIRWNNGSVSPFITVTTGGQYAILYNDLSGCGFTRSDTTLVIVNPLPVITISGNPAFCPGSTTTLNAGSYVSYLWSTGATSQTINVGSLGTYTVAVVDGNGCRNSKSINVAQSPVPFPNISGPSNFCPGTSATLDAGAGYSSYAWTPSGNSRTISITNAGTYSVTVSNSSGCTGSTSRTINQYIPPSPSISGNPSFCPGSSTTLTANLGYNSYAWTGGSNNRSITVNTASSYTVTVTDGNTCTGTATINTSFYPVPAPVISGDLAICQGSTTVLDAGANYSSYLWTTGSALRSIAVSTASTYGVTVTNTYGCSASTTTTTTFNNPPPATPGAITGQLTGLCTATGKVFTVAPVANALTYLWTTPAGCTITNGQGTNQVTVSFNNFQDATLSVVALNTCGQSGVSTAHIIGLPDAVGPISGRIDNVCRQNGFTYSIAPLVGATSYTWTVPAGATLVSGQSTTSIVVNYTNSFSTGSVCVTVGNACGLSSRCLPITAIPAVPASITGPSGVCKKAQRITYSCATVPGNPTYTWDTPNGGRVTSGQGTPNVLINFSNSAGLVTVNTSNTCGSSNLFSYNVNFICREVSEEVNSLSTITEATAFPNPTNGKLSVSFISAEAAKYSLKVMDLIGNVIYLDAFKAMEGNNLKEIDLTNAAKGMYILSIENENTKTKTMKIIVD